MNDVRNSERMLINVPNKILQANRTLLVYLHEQKEKFSTPAISFIFSTLLFEVFFELIYGTQLR